MAVVVKVGSILVDNVFLYKVLLSWLQIVVRLSICVCLADTSYCLSCLSDMLFNLIKSELKILSVLMMF